MVGGSHTVLVTGATGFLGRRVVTAFAKEGYRVIAASRTVEQAELPPGVEARRLDITDPSTIRPALHGADIVVHAAAMVGDWGRSSEFYEIIRDGTENLLNACRGRSLYRFVHISSTLFYGSAGRGVMTEGMLPGHTQEPYTEAKIAAEQHVKRAREQLGLPTVILRPANIFGPGSVLWTERPAQAIKRGLMNLPTDAGRANPVYVDNVVAAVRTVCTHNAAVGETFNVVDDDELTWMDFFGHYAQALGKGTIATRPPWMLYALARTMEFGATISGGTPLVTRFGVTYLRFGGTFAKSKLEERLGHRRAMSFSDALEHTAAYVRERYG